ncbi:hypothetical protein L7F22_047570 [Adiantum nelumboides]|nr:hypothetical protein [Adiantum nelumboides]
MVVALQEQGSAVNALVMSCDGSLLYWRIVVWRKSSPCWPHKAAAASQLLRVQEKLQGHARAVLCLDLLEFNADSGASSLLHNDRGFEFEECVAYFIPSVHKTISKLMEETILEAGRSGLKHLTLGVLSKNEAMNGDGLLSVEKFTT